MIGPARARRAVLHLRLVRLRVCDEFLQIAGGKIIARDQHQRLIHHQHHRSEIGRGVVERRLVERLVLRVRADIAQHELIAVGRGLGDAVRPRHAAGTADVFHDHGLMELDAQAVRDDAGDGVGRSAGGKRRHHGHRPVRPVLRVRRMRDQNQGEGGQGLQRLHSITSSAATSRPGGTVRPSAFAALRLTAVSYRVGACTGRSAGLSPRRMRSTYEATSRNMES